MQRYFSVFLLLFIFTISSAQVSFNSKPQMLGEEDVRGVNCQAVTDMNGDYKDDIVRFHEGRKLFVEYQHQAGLKFPSEEIPNNLNNEWTLCVGDLDNDGLNEIMTSGAYDGAFVFGKDNVQDLFELKQSTNNNFFAQGSNFADINNDGFNDIFICDDDAASEIFLNMADGSGTLDWQPDFIDMTTTPASDNSGNYGSTWSDIDMDGDLDLYIAKCRLFASDVTDPRRINALFVNDGNGNYEEKAAEFNIASGFQSWAADFGDIDNDGDFDLFIVEHDAPYALYENINNETFVQIENFASQTLQGLAIECKMVDFDNDGWLDILITGDDEYILWNKGDKSFEVDVNPVGSKEIHSFSIGDLNEDGFCDIYGTYGTGYNSPGSFGDELWINAGNDNHSITFALEGMVSNKSAIGTKIILEGAWGQQLREVRSGEAYGIMNSLNLSFGTAEHTIADKVTILWPSGITDIYEDVDFSTDNKFLAVEGQCMNPFIDLAVNEYIQICEGEALTLTAPAVNGSIEWSTGETSNTIAVVEEGFYFIRITDASGCIQMTNSVFVDFVSEDANPEVILVQGFDVNCPNDGVVLSTGQYNSYNWSNGDNTQEIQVYETGEYSVEVEGACGILSSATFYVEFVDAPQPPTTTDDFLVVPGVATLEAVGDSIHWYDDAIGSNLLGTGPVFITPFIDITTVYYAQNLIEITQGGGIIGMSEPEANGSIYSGNQFNGGMNFDALNDITIESATVYTDIYGPRKVMVVDLQGMVIAEQIIDVQQDTQEVVLDLFVPQGNSYYLTTDGNYNLNEFGFESPRLGRSNTNVMYPYELDQSMRIYNSVFGFEYYYFFFDMKISGQGQFCGSDYVETVANVEPSSVEELSQNQLALFPNPVSQSLQIQSEDLQLIEQVIINDQYGRLIHSTKVGKLNIEVNTESWSSGVYHVRILKGNKWVTTSIFRS